MGAKGGERLGFGDTVIFLDSFRPDSFLLLRAAPCILIDFWPGEFRFPGCGFRGHLIRDWVGLDAWLLRNLIRTGRGKDKLGRK